MSGTALYKALIEAGASEQNATEATRDLDNIHKSIDNRLSNLEIKSSVLDAKSNIIIVLLIAILVKSFF